MQATEDWLRSFFSDFLGSQYKSVAYSDCVAAACKTFKPAAFIDRAQSAAAAAFTAGLAINVPEIRARVSQIEAEGLESVIATAAQRLRDDKRVLTREAVLEYFSDDPDLERLLQLADGCSVPAPPDFVPNFGEGGATMRANRDADPSAPLLVHALKDAEAGLSIILPLSVVVKAAKAAGINFMCQSPFLGRRGATRWDGPSQIIHILPLAPHRTTRT